MAERKLYDPGLIAIGEMFTKKRKSLGEEYKTREKFIENRSDELFNGNSWISPRHLSNIELGKNWVSIEKLLSLAAALETDPVDLFEEMINIYYKYH